MNFLINSPVVRLFQGDLTLLYILPAMLVAVSFHEGAHAWMANRMGDPTAKNLGRLTLDPTKHFDIWGILMFAFIGFGWGKPVPTNPRNYYNYKKANVLVALAGVTTNLVLSFIFYGVIFLLTYVFRVTNEIILSIVNFMITINIILCFFNLIPIPPLDGHHLIKGFIAKRSQKFYMLYQNYGFFVLMALLFFTDFIQIALTFVVTWVTYGYRLFFGLFI